MVPLEYKTLHQDHRELRSLIRSGEEQLFLSSAGTPWLSSQPFNDTHRSAFNERQSVSGGLTFRRIGEGGTREGSSNLKDGDERQLHDGLHDTERDGVIEQTRNPSPLYTWLDGDELLGVAMMYMKPCW